MRDTGLGFDDFNFDKNKRQGRTNRSSGRGRPSPRSGVRSRVGKTVLGGLLGLGAGWGASKILGLDDETAQNVEIAGGVARERRWLHRFWCV